MVISVADAYRPGPDGVVDTSPGSLFDQYKIQQAGYNANVGTAPGNPTLTQGQQYMVRYPDVQQDAIGRANAEGLFSGDAFSNRLDEIAQEHFNLFGVADGRTGFGYTPPQPGTFTPSPNDTPMFGPPPGNTVSGPPPGNTGGNTMPGTMQPGQPAFDNSGYQTALNNFGGLLSNYGDFFGGLLSGAQNAQANMPPQGQNYSGFYGPGQTPSFSGFNPYPSFSGGFSNASTWGGGNATSGGNTGHRQLWTT